MTGFKSLGLYFNYILYGSKSTKRHGLFTKEDGILEAWCRLTVCDLRKVSGMEVRNVVKELNKSLLLEKTCQVFFFKAVNSSCTVCGVRFFHGF